MSYRGASVSTEFMKRWRSRSHIGSARPWMRVSVRRGRFARSWHDDWPNPQFGQVVGQSISHQWYADWTPETPWVDLGGVSQVDLDQSFDKNGITVATIDIDNVRWVEKTGVDSNTYRERERGFMWPWRGYVPPNRPGSGDARNEFWRLLPNAQLLVEQGYGEDTAVKTFTGLIDSFPLKVRPDRLTITARDFGSVLPDCNLFGWNKTKGVHDPITFMPYNHPLLKKGQADGKQHRWIIIKESVDIVKCILRWAGFKEWEIQDSGVTLATPYTVDKSKTYMDVINDVKEQLGYVFFIAEPSEDDLSIGRPIFRPSSVLTNRSQPITIRDKDFLTDFQPQHGNSQDRYIIRVRGVVNKRIGRTVGGDTTRRVTFTYWPPWMPDMAGVIKQLTYYNIGSQGVLGYTTVQQCTVACVLIAVQIALARDTGTFQTPGLPTLGLDSFAYVTDAGTGVASRVYITNRKSTMKLGGDGSSRVASPYGSSGASQNDLLWASEFGGALCDNPQFQHLINDYDKAIAGQSVLSWGTPT